MAKIASQLLVDQANNILNYIKKNTIPYTDGGMTLAGMDCQGAVEFCLIQAGIPEKECNLAGSNKHFRACVWTGTPEECVAAFGSIPAGAAIFILEFDGGEVARGYTDGLGNASHMGLWTGKTSLAASAGKEKVIESNFKGKTIPNGGWNRVGLMPWVNYGLSTDKQALLTAAETVEEVTIAQRKWTPIYDHLRFAKGDKGGGTREIQTALKSLGYDLDVDGDFGEDTDTAVRAFQRESKLTMDGVVGKNTWAALATAVNAA